MSIRKLFRGTIVTLGAVAFGAAVPDAGARAAVILTFGQSGAGSPITGTQTAPNTTTITASNAPVSITQIDAAETAPFNAYLDVNLTSTSGALPLSGNLEQHFSGSFSITSGSGDTGINYLSGTVTDIAFGYGTEFNLSATTPPAGNVTFTSAVIPSADLGLDRGAGFSFANVDPLLNILDGTFGPFTASVSGTFSANQYAVAEPAGLAVLGAGLIGVGTLRRRRRA
jgi:hypothetical protein